jgi:hypothetical protein
MNRTTFFYFEGSGIILKFPGQDAINYPNYGKNGKNFFPDFLIKRSSDRIFWKKFLVYHCPPSGQGKLTFKSSEDTVPACTPAGREGDA